MALNSAGRVFDCDRGFRYRYRTSVGATCGSLRAIPGYPWTHSRAFCKVILAAENNNKNRLKSICPVTGLTSVDIRIGFGVLCLTREGGGTMVSRRDRVEIEIPDQRQVKAKKP
jgi:hypothetical protein